MTEPTDKAEKARLASAAYYSRNKEQLRESRNTEEYRARKKAQSAKYRADNPQAKEADRLRYQEKRSSPLTWGKTALSTMKQRAAFKGLPFDLTAEDLVVPEFCPVLGIKLVFDVNDNDARPSADRFDNDKGYVKGNVRVISLRANRLKSDATIDELRRVLKYMEGLE